MELIEETLECIKDIGKKEEDVLWVGSQDGDYSISLEGFKKLGPIEYNKRYGHTEISGLVVVFNDGSYLERGEYDGSEWWYYCKTPKKMKD